MTKAAIAHLTRCLAVEWGQHGITVNAVAPTFIHTPGTEPALSDPQFRADVIERIAALHRIGEPIEVAGVVVFLALPRRLADHRRDHHGRRRLDSPLARRFGRRPRGRASPPRGSARSPGPRHGLPLRLQCPRLTPRLRAGRQ